MPSKIFLNLDSTALWKRLYSHLQRGAESEGAAEGFEQERETLGLQDAWECHPHSNLELNIASGFTFATKAACKEDVNKSRDCLGASPLTVQPPEQTQSRSEHMQLQCAE